jgi:hypothetical protein
MILTEKSPVSSTLATKSEESPSGVQFQPLPARPNPPAPMPDTSFRGFLGSVAATIGLNESIILSQLHYWMLNEKAGYYHQGRKWIYNGYKEWLLQFPWLETPRRVGAIVRCLEKIGVVISSNFNHNPYDRRKWYTLDYEAIYQLTGWNPLNLRMSEKMTMDCSSTDNGLSTEETFLYIDYPHTQPQNNNNKNVAFSNDKQEEAGTSTGIDTEAVVEAAKTENRNEAPSHASKTPFKTPQSAVGEEKAIHNSSQPKTCQKPRKKTPANDNPEREGIRQTLNDAGLLNPKLQALALTFNLEEVQKSIALLQQKSDAVKNPEGWLTKCLQGRWWKQFERKKAKPATRWEAEFTPWYDWATASGIVENLPVNCLSTDHCGEPIVRLAQPDHFTGAPYTPEPWRSAKKQFPMPFEGMRGGEDKGAQGQLPTLRGREITGAIPENMNESLPSSETRQNDALSDAFPAECEQDWNHSAESSKAREMPERSGYEGTDESHPLPASPSSNSPAPPRWADFPWQPKNGWRPGANRERLLQQKAEWCQGKLLRLSSECEFNTLVQELGEWGFQCIEWVDLHLLTPHDVASRHARIRAQREFHQRLLFGESPGLADGT